MLTHSIIVAKPRKINRSSSRDNKQKRKILQYSLNACLYKEGDHVITCDHHYGVVLEVISDPELVCWANLKPMFVLVYIYDINEEFVYNHHDLNRAPPS